MKRIATLLIVTTLLVPHITLACERPMFIDAVVLPIKERGEMVNETFKKRPGHDSVCIYVATWAEVRDGPEGNILGVYVATYKKEDSRVTAELRYTINADLLWSGPTIEIDPVNYRIHESVNAFGIRTSWGFLGSSFSRSSDQLDLLIPVGESRLRSVLSLLIASGHSARECPVECKIPSDPYSGCSPRCEGENTSVSGVVIIGENAQMGYRDIIVKTTHTTSDPNGVRPVKKRKSKLTFRWDGEKYVLQQR